MELFFSVIVVNNFKRIPVHSLILNILSMRTVSAVSLQIMKERSKDAPGERRMRDFQFAFAVHTETE